MNPVLIPGNTPTAMDLVDTRERTLELACTIFFLVLYPDALNNCDVITKEVHHTFLDGVGGLGRGGNNM